MKLKIQTLLMVASVALVSASVFAADATENWTKNCASCHGKDGSGNTMMGKKDHVKDLRDPKVQAELTDQKAAEAIKDGVVVDGKQKMKPFKDKLTPDEINALVVEIRKFKK